jgi:hypothetical protein
MSLQPFMPMGPYIRRGASLIQEENVSIMGRKSLNCWMTYKPLNGWQLYIAEGTRRKIQQLPGETGKLITKPNKQSS